jgi:hypothetical protein
VQDPQQHTHLSGRLNKERRGSAIVIIIVQWLTVLAQRSSFVDIDSDLIIDRPTQNIKGAVLNQLDLISKTTKADIFLLMPKTPDIESASFNGNLDSTMDPRLRCAIYGDLETMEHAKTRVLIMIDQIVSLECAM